MGVTKHGVRKTETSGTSTTIFMPDGSNVTDYGIVAVVQGNTSGTITWPAGWTNIGTNTDSGTGYRFEARYHLVTGSEGWDGTDDSISLSHSSSDIVAVVWTFSSHGIATSAPAIGTFPTGDSVSPDPPNLTPAWGSDENYWICGYANNDHLTPSYPTNYTLDNISSTRGSLGTMGGAGFAARILTATSENPGAFTDNGDTLWYAWTIAVRGPTSVTVTGVTLTITPSLPTAGLKHSLPGATLSITPSFPQAGTRHSLTGATLLVPPDFPASTLRHSLPGVTLDVPPSFPQGLARRLLRYHPVSDATLGGWVDENFLTTDIYQSIAEDVRDDLDYVQSPPGPAGEVYETDLQSIEDPSTSGGHTVRYAYRKNSSATTNITVRLMQGVTEIASWTHNDVSETVTEASQTLTPTQADSITDYTNLSIRLEATVV